MSTTTASSPAQSPRSTKDIDFHVDSNAPLFVASAVVGSALLGGTTGALVAVKSRLSPIHMAVATALRSGIFGLAFFGSREYLISPILSGVRAAEGGSGSGATATMGQVRTERVLDSAIAGALAGGALSFGIRGPRTTLPAAFTTALLASVVQFGVNEVRVQRLELLARRARAADLTHSSASTFTDDDLPELPTVAEALGEDTAKAPGAKRGDSPLTQRVLEKLTAILPIQKITDDEYLATMEKRKRDIAVRLKEIDGEQLALFERSSGAESL